MTSAMATTTQAISNTTHIYDTYDLFIHPHWKQFPLVSDAWHYGVGIWITFFGFSGVFGNFLVIYIFGTTKTLRTPSNMFVVNLALSDLTFSAVNGFPLFSLSAFNKRWIFGKVACEFYGLIGGIFGLMSINTMAAIAIDRYNVITKPIAASRSLSYRKAFIMLIFVWVWSLVWTLPPLFGWGAYIPEGFQTSCTFDYLTNNDYFRSYIMGLYLGGFCVPLSIILFCYFFIYRTVALHEKEMGKMAQKLNAEIRQGQAQQKSDIKTAKIAMTIITAYLISWTPYATIALIAQFGDASLINPYLSELPVIFAKASAMHNPIIYALSHPRFREVLNKRFPWLLCCCNYKAKEAESMPDKSKISRMDSANSNVVGGAMSQVSEMSNLSDGDVQEVPNRNMRMKNMQGGAPAAAAGGGAQDGALIRDILTAFVGVVNAQGQRQAPVYMPPQYMAQYAAQGAVPPQGGVYTLPGGADSVPNPPPPPPPISSVSQPVTPQPIAALAAQCTKDSPAAAVCTGTPTTPVATPVTTQAEVNAHVNQAYQED